jgi:hypothetical protein
MASKSQGTNRISFEDVGIANDKVGVTATTTALLEQDESHEANEGGVRRPDCNLTAAIWTIVCGVGLPCIPVRWRNPIVVSVQSTPLTPSALQVMIVSSLLLWIVLHKRVDLDQGLLEL